MADEIPSVIIPEFEGAPEPFTIRIDRPGYEPVEVTVCRHDSAKVIGANVLAAVHCMWKKHQAHKS